MNYGYGYGGDISDVFGAFSGMFLGFGVVIFLIFAVWVGLYVLQSLGLQKMAQHRGEKYAWFAWIPFLNYILIGNMVGEFKISKYDIKKPGLFMAILGLGIVNVELFGTCFIMIFAMIPVLGWIIAFVIGVAVFAYPIAVMVFMYMLLYKLYKQYAPDKATMFLVLTILFNSIAMPVFFFMHRDKPPVYLPEVDKEKLQ